MAGVSADFDRFRDAGRIGSIGTDRQKLHRPHSWNSGCGRGACPVPRTISSSRLGSGGGFSTSIADVHPIKTPAALWHFVVGSSFRVPTI